MRLIRIGGLRSAYSGLESSSEFSECLTKGAAQHHAVRVCAHLAAYSLRKRRYSKETNGDGADSRIWRNRELAVPASEVKVSFSSSKQWSGRSPPLSAHEENFEAIPKENYTDHVNVVRIHFVPLQVDNFLNDDVYPRQCSRLDRE
jgi:hypothetical protein